MCLIHQIEKDYNALVDELFKGDRISTLLKNLRELLVNTWDEKSREAVSDAIRQLTFAERTATETDINNIIVTLEGHLGTSLAEAQKLSLYNLTEAIYGRGAAGAAKELGIALSFSLQDTKAIRALSDQSVFFIGNFYTDNLSADIKSALLEGMKNDLSTYELADMLTEKFGEAFDKGNNYFEQFARHHTTRSKEFGAVESYQKAGIEFLEVVAVMDARTTPICQAMNGRRIPVARAAKFRDAVVNVKTPEDIKNISPWRDAEDVEGKDVLPVGMSLPPYHFGCRTTTVAVFD